MREPAVAVIARWDAVARASVAAPLQRGMGMVHVGPATQWVRELAERVA
jgi:hypothetical protein